MNKKFFLFALLLLLVPACKRKRYMVTPCPPPAEPTVIAQERAEYDEELGAFIVKDDQNKFSAAAAARADVEEELTAETTERSEGDKYADSEKYGFKPIFFEFDKYKVSDLRPDQRPVLEHDLKKAKALADKGYTFVIAGHASSEAGSTEYNMMLSEDRASATRKYFADHGVDAKIDIVGYGCTQLIVPSGNREQQAPNRRIEIFAYPQKSADYEG